LTPENHFGAEVAARYDESAADMFEPDVLDPAVEFLAELPKPHIEEETTMTGGESLWRAQWSERADPFAHLGPAQSMRASTRGPGWQRASREGRFNSDPKRVIEARASAVSLGNQGRTDLALGQRVFHGKFGYGIIAAIEGNKLEIDFEHAGRKKVLDSFVSAG